MTERRSETPSLYPAVLAAAFCALLAPAAAAQTLPQHLSAMAAALFAELEPELKQADPNDSRGWATRKAYETLLAQRIERWSTEGFPEFSALPELAAALELDPAAPQDREKLADFMAETVELGSEQAFRNFAEREGRSLGNDAAVQQYMEPIDTALAKGWDGLEREAALTSPDGREVLFDWTPEKNLFAIEVADPGDAFRAESLTRMAAEMQPDFTGDSETVPFELTPAKDAIQALDSEDLALARANVFGEWVDQHGKLWVIEPEEGAAPRSAPEPTEEPASVAILREIAEKQSRLGALQGGEAVFVWENGETGEREEQTRFKRLSDPWVYLGEEAPGGAEAAEERARLEEEIAALQSQLESAVLTQGAPALPEPDAESGVRGLRVTTQRHTDDSFFTYDQAVLQNGAVKARRTLRSMSDISGLPETVIQQLVSQYHPPEWIEMAISREPDSGEWRIEGSEWRLHVTYSGDDYRVKSIHTPYPKPLILRREGQKAP